MLSAVKAFVPKMKHQMKKISVNSSLSVNMSPWRRTASWQRDIVGEMWL